MSLNKRSWVDFEDYKELSNKIWMVGLNKQSLTKTTARLACGGVPHERTPMDIQSNINIDLLIRDDQIKKVVMLIKKITHD
ncbi:hypothetical protein BpHYR1_033561 [Brachionus plicatilis]|uniref:Uncharacterized protein n=1 Tax=Brachionus plicatilis TaxID=10195 RepID=A0A3M7Q3U2_BRAPC|nr:hypothetical protein BpHYR1_033561 [Brachionus plicatilis]